MEATEHKCPKCNRLLYNRRFKICGYCGSPLPEELLFSPAELAEIEREEKERELKRLEAELKKEKRKPQDGGISLSGD
jgi:hypothetical protein